jgi:hypothetical protein
MTPRDGDHHRLGYVTVRGHRYGRRNARWLPSDVFCGLNSAELPPGHVESRNYAALGAGEESAPSLEGCDGDDVLVLVAWQKAEIVLRRRPTIPFARAVSNGRGSGSLSIKPRPRQ